MTRRNFPVREAKTIGKSLYYGALSFGIVSILPYFIPTAVAYGKDINADNEKMKRFTGILRKYEDETSWGGLAGVIGWIAQGVLMYKYPYLLAIPVATNAGGYFHEDGKDKRRRIERRVRAQNRQDRIRDRMDDVIDDTPRDYTEANRIDDIIDNPVEIKPEYKPNSRIDNLIDEGKK